jgi:hypothetical protein
LQERLVLLGTVLPSFQQAARLLGVFCGVQVSEPTARRSCEAAGAAGEMLEQAELAHLQKQLPPPPPGAEKQCLSVDGAYVPLVGGEWAEVRTLVVGTVGEPVLEEGQWVVHARELSYFSRLADAETFTEAALVEIQRRGVEGAQQVAGVVDGALWCQGFLDFHRPDAQRILDFPHAAERLAQIGALLLGEGSAAAREWTQQQCHTLEHQGPQPLLEQVRQQCAVARSLLKEGAAGQLAEHLAYLEKRVAQLDYPLYRQQGWPIGSGMVESANKLVVQERLKGPGMHWARAHVNPLLVLRGAYCSERWEATWTGIEQQRRAQGRQRAAARREQRAAARPTASLREASVPEATTRSALHAQVPETRAEPPPPKPSGPAPGRPHPWRRFHPGWLSSTRKCHAKL